MAQQLGALAALLKEPRLVFQHPRGGSQPPLTPVSGDSGLHKQA